MKVLHQQPRETDMAVDEERIKANDQEAPNAIDTLGERIGEWARGHGFWEGFEAADILLTLSKQAEQCIEQDMAVKFEPHIPEELARIANLIRTLTIASKIALMHSELSEALESLRTTGFDGHLAGEGNMTEEFADTIIRVLDTIDNIGAAPGAMLIEKHKTNQGRPVKHGRKM